MNLYAYDEVAQRNPKTKQQFEIYLQGTKLPHLHQEQVHRQQNNKQKYKCISISGLVKTQAPSSERWEKTGLLGFL